MLYVARVLIPDLCARARTHTGAPNTLRRARGQRTLDQPSRTAEYDIRDTCWGDGTTLPLGLLLRCRLPRERSRKGPYSNAQRERQVCLRVEFVWSSCGVSVRTQAFSGVLKLAHTPANTHTTSWGRSTELRILGSLILQTKTGALSTDHGDGSKRASIRIQHGGYFRRCHRRQQS